AAFPRQLLVKGRVREMFDVEGDAIPEGQHQNDRTDEREPQPDGIAQQFHGFAPGISPQSSRIESPGSTRWDALGRRSRWLWRLGLLCLVGCFLQIADEGVLERSAAALLDEF